MVSTFLSRSLARRLAIGVAVCGAGFAGVVASPHTALAAAFQTKNCVGPGPGGGALAGQSVTCTVTINQDMPLTGGSTSTDLSGPAGATVTGCSSSTAGVTAFFTAPNHCAFSRGVSLANLPAGSVIGSETVMIAAGTPVGSTITQSGFFCPSLAGCGGPVTPGADVVDTTGPGATVVAPGGPAPAPAAPKPPKTGAAPVSSSTGLSSSALPLALGLLLVIGGVGGAAIGVRRRSASSR